ncbi:protein cornichon homolog 3 isoform X1 [Heterocephalus glaber]|uniref:Protein cornichon homolog 3 isoform X1 n=1 Tax=Heterocephalus glaber TaxID=10181 RepID=A0AAX6S0Q7_HETGA|nr:protein cornichon homolog 3 isoform X1 [Heterocephalus glaber]
MAFTFAAFCYMLALVLCAALIFFAIWHVTVQFPRLSPASLARPRFRSETARLTALICLLSLEKGNCSRTDFRVHVCVGVGCTVRPPLSAFVTLGRSRITLRFSPVAPHTFCAWALTSMWQFGPQNGCFSEEEVADHRGYNTSTAAQRLACSLLCFWKMQCHIMKGNQSYLPEGLGAWVHFRTWSVAVHEERRGLQRSDSIQGRCAGAASALLGAAAGVDPVPPSP